MGELLLKGCSIGEIKGVLFDKDGTLSNSEAHLINLAKRRIQAATNLFKKRSRTTGVTKKLKSLLSSAYGLTFDGLCPDGVLAIATRKDNLISTATVFCLLGEPWPLALTLAEEIFSAVDLKDETTLQSGSDIRTLLPGALPLLEKLTKANVKCALISNDTSKGIQSFLEKNDLQKILGKYWSSEDVPPKPNPEAIQGLCQKLDLSPSECALIGDSDTDLKMGLQAGIGLRLGYTAGWRKPPTLSGHQYLIHHWDDLSLKANPKVRIKLSSL